MAYNNYPVNMGYAGFVPYMQPQILPQVQQQIQQPEQNSNSFIWVQGKEAAKAYPVGSGKDVLLMDSDEPYLYIKSTDINGKPNKMKIYRLVEETEEPEVVEKTPMVNYLTTEDIKDFATQKDYNDLIDLINSIQKEIDSLKNNNTNVRKAAK